MFIVPSIWSNTFAIVHSIHSDARKAARVAAERKSCAIPLALGTAERRARKGDRLDVVDGIALPYGDHWSV